MPDEELEEDEASGEPDSVPEAEEPKSTLSELCVVESARRPKKNNVK